MINKTKLYSVVARHFPEFVQHDYRKFIAFVEAYYKFLDQYLGDVNTQRNVDTAYDEFLPYFRKELSDGLILPESNERFNLSNFKQFYSTKGSEEAFKVIFRVFFNEEVSLTYPSEQILRTSDGIWVQENFVTVIKTYGELPSSVEYLHVDNAYGQFKVHVTDVLQINDVSARFTYNTTNRVVFEPDQIIKILDETNKIIYAGVVLSYSPSKVNIISGGTGWKRGQIIIFPGGVKDTSIRVTNVDHETGEILNLEVLEYGYPHLKDQTYKISPYSAKPLQSTITESKVVTGILPFTYHYTLNISDNTDGIYDETVGRTNSVEESEYNFNNYKELGYIGKDTLASNHLVAPTAYSADISNLTIEQWENSKVFLHFGFDQIPKKKGEYKEDRGQVSNEKSVFQDNYYYQAFSYVIETEQPIEKYESLLPAIHPTGLAQFSAVLKTKESLINFIIERNLSREKLDFTDVATMSEVAHWYLVKKLVDSIEPTEENNIELIKLLLDETTNEEFISKHFTKAAVDATDPASDYRNLEFTKTLADSYDTSNVIETKNFNFVKDKVTDNTDPATEFLKTDFTKFLYDTAEDSTDAKVVDFTKVLSDSYNTSDITETKTFDITKLVTDSTDPATDKGVLDFTKLLVDSSDPVTESLTITSNKYVTDSATASSSETTVAQLYTYSEDGTYQYFADTYTNVETVLTIGN